MSVMKIEIMSREYIPGEGMTRFYFEVDGEKYKMHLQDNEECGQVMTEMFIDAECEDDFDDKEYSEIEEYLWANAICWGIKDE